MPRPAWFKSSGFCYFLRILAWLSLAVGIIGGLVNAAGPHDPTPAIVTATSGIGSAIALFALAKALDLLEQIRDAAQGYSPPKAEEEERTGTD